MNILLLASHAVAEYDDVRMFSDAGYDVFAPGGYEVPSRSGEGIRPALPDAPHHPDLVERLHETRASYRTPPGPFIDWGKAKLHPDIVDWADVIIVHHFPERWIGGQWDAIRHKRVIWRTCGQSDPRLEREMATFAADGMQIVRYSPAEKRYFESVGSFAGQDALIRFGKYPADYGPWTGDWTVYNNDLGPIVGATGQGTPYVANVTQDMVARGDSCGLGFWQAATEGLAVAPAGQGSEALGGLGTLDYPMMLKYLAGSRVYLYTGTTPASYTLGLIEAMLTGVPVVSIGPDDWRGPEALFEGHRIAWEYPDADLSPAAANKALRFFLDHPNRTASDLVRDRAKTLFDIATVTDQWREFLA